MWSGAIYLEFAFTSEGLSFDCEWRHLPQFNGLFSLDTSFIALHLYVLQHLDVLLVHAGI